MPRCLATLYGISRLKFLNPSPRQSVVLSNKCNDTLYSFTIGVLEREENISSSSLLKAKVLYRSCTNESEYNSIDCLGDIAQV